AGLEFGHRGASREAEITPVEPDPVSTGEGRQAMDLKTPSWGIEPVPERLRVLGFADTFLLWLNLGISLLVLVLPAYFDLPLGKALLATLVGGLIGNAMLAVAALIGADARVPTMVLQRAPLGQQGSYLATGLNVLQCFGWAIFELIVIATAAGLLSHKLFGFEARWFWTLLFGVGFGYLLPTFFQFGFGSVLVLSREIDPNRPELILTAIAGGGFAAALALLALTVDETDEAFANVYSAAVSLQNLLPRAPQRLLIGVSAGLATLG